MVNKSFEQVTYSYGQYSQFTFGTTGTYKVYNSGYGTGLLVTPSSKPEKVPLLGFVAPLNIIQSKNSGDSIMKLGISVDVTSSKYLGSDFGLVFAIKFGQSTKSALTNNKAEFYWGELKY